MSNAPTEPGLYRRTWLNTWTNVEQSEIVRVEWREGEMYAVPVDPGQAPAYRVAASRGTWERVEDGAA